MYVGTKMVDTISPPRLLAAAIKNSRWVQGWALLLMVDIALT